MRGIVAEEVVVCARPRRAPLDASREIRADELLSKNEPLSRCTQRRRQRPLASRASFRLDAGRIAPQIEDQAVARGPDELARRSHIELDPGIDLPAVLDEGELRVALSGEA
jgi:hypothetical protein